MNRFNIFETQFFTLKINSLSYNDSVKLKGILQKHIYPELKNEPRYGRNIRNLLIDDDVLWRYNLGKFRIFYVVNDKDCVIFLLTLDVRY